MGNFEHQVASLRLSIIEPNREQPRRNFDKDALASLADSIAVNGVLQPILVKRSGNGMYSIIAGERRWRASRIAGLVEIPAIIVDFDDFTVAKIALIENLQREDLNPHEEALGYSELMRKYSLTQEEIANHVGKSRSSVANSLRLLALPPEVHKLIISGDLDAGHARALLGLVDKSKIVPFAEIVIERNLSVRDIEAMVKRANASADESDKPKDKKIKVDYISDLEDKVTSTIGRRCRIFNTKKRHTIQVDYIDNDDLEDILKRLCGKRPIDD